MSKREDFSDDIVFRFMKDYDASEISEIFYLAGVIEDVDVKFVIETYNELSSYGGTPAIGDIRDYIYDTNLRTLSYIYERCYEKDKNAFSSWIDYVGVPESVGDKMYEIIFGDDNAIMSSKAFDINGCEYTYQDILDSFYTQIEEETVMTFDEAFGDTVLTNLCFIIEHQLKDYLFVDDIGTYLEKITPDNISLSAFFNIFGNSTTYINLAQKNVCNELSIQELFGNTEQVYKYRDIVKVW